MSIRPRCAVLNRSTVATDSEVSRITKALQRQLDRHFTPKWSAGAFLNFVPKASSVGWQGRWNLVVLDTSDEANALGYHDMTPDGLPLGKCFAKTDKLAGAELSVTMSHELLEMLGDPLINLMAADRQGRIYAYENADAVQDDARGYDIDGVRVSNFVLPAWFSPDVLEGTPVDHLGKLSVPFELDRGGYISYTDTWPPAWEQQFAATADPLARPKVGSRRERRTTAREHWRRSVA